MDCSVLEAVTDEEIVFPSPKRFEFSIFRKSEIGKVLGSVIPEKVIPNWIFEVDCSSTVQTKSTRFSSEPCCGSGIMFEKYWRFIKFLIPFIIFSLEKRSPSSIGISRLITFSFVLLFPLMMIFSIWLLECSTIVSAYEISWRSVFFNGIG